jgi:hypothetical protein
MAALHFLGLFCATIDLVPDGHRANTTAHLHRGGTDGRTGGYDLGAARRRRNREVSELVVAAVAAAEGRRDRVGPESTAALEVSGSI